MQLLVQGKKVPCEWKRSASGERRREAGNADVGVEKKGLPFPFPPFYCPSIHVGSDGLAGSAWKGREGREGEAGREGTPDVPSPVELGFAGPWAATCRWLGSLSGQV